MENACIQVGDFKRFNPEKSLIIDSVCTEQCDNAISISYQFEVLLNMGTLNQPNWVLYDDKQGLLEGKLISDYQILLSNKSSPNLFLNHPQRCHVIVSADSSHSIRVVSFSSILESELVSNRRVSN